MNAVRAARQQLALSQRAFAALIDVSVETVRAWDSGRRRIPAAAVAAIRAAAFQHLRGVALTVLDAEVPAESAAPALHSSDASGTSSDATSQHLSPLREVARAIGVSVYTLRAAVRDGRLAAVYSTRVVFGRPIPLSTVADGLEYFRRYHGRRRRWVTWPPTPEPLPTVPADYDVQLRSLRRRAGLTQTQLATAIGAANKAVVYQWESRKRRPSPVLWQRIDAFARERKSINAPLWKHGSIRRHLSVLLARPARPRRLP